MALAEPVFEGAVKAMHTADTLEGQVIAGAVTSLFTVIVCTQVLKLPAQSVAFHVRATTRF